MCVCVCVCVFVCVCLFFLLRGFLPFLFSPFPTLLFFMRLCSHHLFPPTRLHPKSIPLFSAPFPRFCCADGFVHVNNTTRSRWSTRSLTNRNQSTSFRITDLMLMTGAMTDGSHGMKIQRGRYRAESISRHSIPCSQTKQTAHAFMKHARACMNSS